MENKSLDNISLSDIQLFLINAERLYNDSKTVSFPTKVALIEISLEEVAKGWFFMLKFLKRHPMELSIAENFIESSAINKIPTNELNEFSKKFSDLVDRVESFTYNDLIYHKKKIEILSLIKQWIQNILDLQIKYPFLTSYEKISEFVTRGIIRERFDTNEIKNVLQKAKEFLSQINEDKLEKITKLKEDGFYVDITPSGHAKSPTLLTESSLNLNYLEIFLQLLIDYLKFLSNMAIGIES